MRILRLKIDKAVAIRLKQVATEYRAQPDFVEDVYALARLFGNGLPSANRETLIINEVAKITKDALMARIIVRKRIQVLKAISQMPYFTSVSRLPNPVHATEKLLGLFAKVGQAIRRSQCASCALKVKCQFGQQYDNLVTDVTKIIDPDFDKKVHEDCPHRPDIDMTQRVNETIKFMDSLFDPANQQQNQALIAQLNADASRMGGDEVDDEALEELEAINSQNDPENAEEDDSDDVDDTIEDDFTPTTVAGCAKGKRFSGSFTAEYYVKVQEQMIESLLKLGLDLFELARNLNAMLAAGKSEEYQKSKEMSEHHDASQMRTPSDIVKMAPSQLALPENMLDAKIAKKEIIVREEKAPIKKRHLMYILLDISGSMRTMLNGRNHQIISRASFASVFSTAIVKKIKDENGISFIRFFDNRPSPLYSMRKAAEFDDLIAKIKHCNFDGGGTNIDIAIRTALKDINDSKDEIAKSEILLITDGDDSVGTAKKEFGKTKFNVLDVSGSSSASYGNGRASLQGIADKYYKTDANQLNIKDIVSLAK